jgi:calcium-dependent protein kinase
MSPEVLLGNYNVKADVWSLGVIAFMLLSSSMPFYGSTRKQVIQRIIKGKFQFQNRRWKGKSDTAKAFVVELLQRDAKARPTADRALTHLKFWIDRLEKYRAPAHGGSQKQQFTHCTSSSSEEDMEMMDKVQCSIQSFSQYNTLKKLALMVVAFKSTASEIGWLRTVFKKFDLKRNGEISHEEFTEALLDIYDYTPEEAEALFHGMDLDGTGSVHYTEFLAATIEAHGSIDEHRIADAFDRIDSDDTGFITVRNCKSLHCLPNSYSQSTLAYFGLSAFADNLPVQDFLGSEVPLEHLERIIDEADIAKDKR